MVHAKIQTLFQPVISADKAYRPAPILACIIGSDEPNISSACGKTSSSKSANIGINYFLLQCFSCWQQDDRYLRLFLADDETAPLPKAWLLPIITILGQLPNVTALSTFVNIDLKEMDCSSSWLLTSGV